MMTDKSPNLRTAVVQTNLRVFQLEDETIVVCDRGCQTVTTTPPSTLNTNFYELLEYTPYSEIVKGSTKVIDLPRKPFLQFNLERSKTLSWAKSFDAYYKKSLKKSNSSLEGKSSSDTIYKSSLKKSLSSLEGLSAFHLILAKMDKAVTDQDCQTILTVSPFVLDEDSVASVYNELAVQTSITFSPGESLSSVAPKLKQIIQHTRHCQAVIVDGKVVTGFDDEDEIEITKFIAQSSKTGDTKGEEIQKMPPIQEETVVEETKGSTRDENETVITIETLNITTPETNSAAYNQKALFLTDEEFERNVQMILDKTVKNVYDFLLKVLEIYNRSVEPPKITANAVSQEALMENVVAPENLESKWINKFGSNVSTASKEALRILFPDRVLVGGNIKQVENTPLPVDSGEEQLDENNTSPSDVVNSMSITHKSNVEGIQTIEELPEELPEEAEDIEDIGRSIVDNAEGNAVVAETIQRDDIGAPETSDDKQEIPAVVGPSIQEDSKEQTDDVGEKINEEPPTVDQTSDVQTHTGESETMQIADNKEDTPIPEEPLATVSEQAEVDEADLSTREEQEPTNITEPEESDSNPSTPKPDEVKSVSFAEEINRFGDSKSNQGDKHIDCECGKLHEGGAAPPTLSQPQEESRVKFELTVSDDAKTVEKTLHGVVVRATISCPELHQNKTSDAKLNYFRENDNIISFSVTIPRAIFASAVQLSNDANNESIHNAVREPGEVEPKPQTSGAEPVANTTDALPPIANLGSDKVGVCYCDLKESAQQLDSSTQMKRETGESTNICSCTSPKQLVSNTPMEINNSTPTLVQDTNPTSADLCECIKLQERTIDLLKTHTAAHSKQGQVVDANQPSPENVCSCRLHRRLDTEASPPISSELSPQQEIVEAPICVEYREPQQRALNIDAILPVTDVHAIITKQTSLLDVPDYESAKGPELEPKESTQSNICQYEEPQQVLPESIKASDEEDQTVVETEIGSEIPTLKELPEGINASDKEDPTTDETNICSEIPTLTEADIRNFLTALDEVDHIREQPFVISRAYLCSCRKLQEAMAKVTAGDENIAHIESVKGDETTKDDDEKPQDDESGIAQHPTDDETGLAGKKEPGDEDATRNETSAIAPYDIQDDAGGLATDERGQKLPTAKAVTHTSTHADVCDCGKPQENTYRHPTPKAITHATTHADVCDCGKPKENTYGVPTPKALKHATTHADVCDCGKPQEKTYNVTKIPVLLKVTEYKENDPLANVCDCHKPQANIILVQPRSSVIQQDCAKSQETLENVQNRFAAVCECGQQKRSTIKQPKNIEDDQQLKTEDLKADVIGDDNATSEEIAIGEKNLLSGEDGEIAARTSIGIKPQAVTPNEVELVHECKESIDLIEDIIKQDIVAYILKETPPTPFDNLGKPSDTATLNALAAICDCCKKLLNMSTRLEKGELLQDRKETAAYVLQEPVQTSPTVSLELKVEDLCPSLEQKENEQCGDSNVVNIPELESTQQDERTSNGLIYIQHKNSIETYMQSLVHEECIEKEIANKFEEKICTCASKQPNCSNVPDNSAEPYMLSLVDESPCTKVSKSYQKQGQAKKMETVQEEEAVEVLYVRNEAPPVLAKSPPPKSKFLGCVCKNPVMSKSDPIYDDDSDYNENYMEELKSDVLMDVIEPDSTPSIPPYLTDTDRCDSKMEMPWLQISLPPPGYYEIKKMKDRPKDACNCWDVDIKDSVLKAAADKPAVVDQKTKCDCNVVKNKKVKDIAVHPRRNNVCHCLPREAIPTSPPKLTDPNSSCICFENITKKLPPSPKPKYKKEFDEKMLCGCLTPGLEDENSAFVKIPSKLVYDTDCYVANEPYLEPLNRQFSDDCDMTDCGPNTEIAWNDIILPKKVKLHQAKKPPIVNVVETEARVDLTGVYNANANLDVLKKNEETDPRVLLPEANVISVPAASVSATILRQPSKPLSSKINISGHIAMTEYQEKHSYTDISNIIKIEGGAASLQTLSAMSTISNIRMKLKRVTKDYLITILMADGNIQQKSGTSILKPVGSQPFIATIGSLGVLSDQISKVIISLKPQSNKMLDASISREADIVFERKTRSVPLIISKELAVIDMEYKDDESQIVDQKRIGSKNAIKSNLLTTESDERKEIKPIKSIEYKDPVMTALETYRAEMKPLQESLNRLKAKIRDLGIPELSNWNQASKGNTGYAEMNGNTNTFDNRTDFNYNIAPPAYPQQMTYGMNAMQLPYSQGYYPMNFGYPQGNMFAPPTPQPMYQNQNMLYPDASDWKSMHTRVCNNTRRHMSRRYSSSKSSSDVSDYDTFSGEESRSSAIESPKATSNDEVSSSRNSLRHGKGAKQNKYQNTNKVDFNCDEDCSTRSKKSGRSDFAYRQSDSERSKTNQLFKGRVEKNQNVKKCHKFKVAVRLNPSNQEVIHQENLTVVKARSGKDSLL